MAGGLLLAAGAVAGVARWQGGVAPQPPGAAAAATSARLTLVPESRHGIDYRAFDGWLDRLAASRDMVGLAVAVVEDGQVVFAKGYGVTQRQGGEPVSTRTVFRWASNSKTVAATLTAKLAERGKLSLDAPVARYRTSLVLPNGGDDVATVIDLLSHRTGLVKNAYDDKLEENIDPAVIRGMYATLPNLCAPGTCFAYQNVAFDTVHEIDERATGFRYPDLVRQELFAPLNMANASVGRIGLVGALSWARPYRGDKELPVEEAYYRVPAAGGVNSSIADLALWMRAQMGMNPNVLSPRLLATIHDPRVRTPRDRRSTEFDKVMTDTSYALGFRNAYYHGHRLVGHRGAVAGYRSLMSFDPERRFGVVALWNSQSLKPIAIPLMLYDRLYGLPAKDWLKLDQK